MVALVGIVEVLAVVMTLGTGGLLGAPLTEVDVITLLVAPPTEVNVITLLGALPTEVNVTTLLGVHLMVEGQEGTDKVIFALMELLMLS